MSSANVTSFIRNWRFYGTPLRRSFAPLAGKSVLIFGDKATTDVLLHTRCADGWRRDWSLSWKYKGNYSDERVFHWQV